MKNRRVLGIYFSFCTMLFSQTITYADKSSNIVAKVGDVSIYYDEIKAKPQLAEVLGVDKLQLEKSGLTGLIKKIIFKQTIKESGITVSEKEIDERLDQTIQKAGINNEYVKKVHDQCQAICDALAQWQKDHSRSNAIYTELLSGKGLTQQMWKTYQINYDTPEKLAKLKSLIPNSIEDMKKNSRESTKRDLLAEKLNEVITKDVSVTDQEVREAFDKQYKHNPQKPDYEKTKNIFRESVLNRKKQKVISDWWKNKYRQSRIVITNNTFEAVKSEMLSP